MKIIIFNAYYYPEKVSSLYLEEDIASGLSRAGHDVTMYVPYPSRGLSREEQRKYKLMYKKNNIEIDENNVKIVHYKLFKEGNNPFVRAIRYIIQNIKQTRILLKNRFCDVVFCGSTPPTQGFFIAKAVRKIKKKNNVSFIYNLQDIFPDSLVNAGFAQKNGFLWKIGRKIEDYTYAQTDKIIAISNDFKNNLMEKGVPEEKIEIVYNWVDINSISYIPKKDNILYDELGLNRDKFNIVYAGNFGYAQNVKVIIDTAEILKNNQSIEFVLFGFGQQFFEIKEYVEKNKLYNVRIYDLLPQERVSEVYSLGDVCLISCKRGFGKCAFPSKTWSILACDRNIVASFDLGSDLDKIIADNGYGIVVEPENAIELSKALVNVQKLDTNKKRSFVLTNASKEKCVRKYVEIMEGTK